MIPDFNSAGYLPAGIYPATIAEYEARFVTNPIRAAIHQGLLKLITDLKTIGCPSIFIDGSYVTTKVHPKDVDVCWDDRGVDYDFAEKKLPILWDLRAPRARQQALYKADVFPAFVEQTGTKQKFLDFFQQIKDNHSENKGIIKIDIYD